MMKTHFIKAVLAVIAIALLPGCHPGSKIHVADDLSALVERPNLRTKVNASARGSNGASVNRRAQLGVSTQGRPIGYEVYGEGSETVLYIASIHGNEPAGTPLLNALARRLESGRLSLGDTRVVLIPISNPDGYERKRRYNANGVDLNRNFPADNFRAKRRHGNKPLSQPESRAIFDAIERFRPSCIISIHQDGACIDFDGPARELARSMSKAGKLKLKRLGSLPGSLGSYAGNQLGIPVVTVELPGGLQGLNEDALWSRYGSILLAPLRWKKGESRRELPVVVEP